MNHAHLTLRPWRLSDAAVLPGLIGDPAVQRNLRDGLPLPYTEEDARAFLTAMLAAERRPSPLPSPGRMWPSGV